MQQSDAPLIPRPEGLYCPEGDFHIDPVLPVARALVTHGHADHARAGHGAVLATRQTLDIMALRYGPDFAQSQQIADGVADINGVRIRFHPAGHVLGSAQISLHTRHQRITITGDYARRPNAACAPWEPVPCDILVTEATFALPVFGVWCRRVQNPTLSSKNPFHVIAQRAVPVDISVGCDRFDAQFLTKF